MLAGARRAPADDDRRRPASPAPPSPSGWRSSRSCSSSLAFLSEHPHGARRGAAGDGRCACSSGIPVSALAGDAVTGIVAGVGAGGIVALRADADAQLAGPRRWRWSIAAVYTFVLVRTAGALALLPAPVFPFTAIGLADHLVERRAERAAHDDEPM